MGRRKSRKGKKKLPYVKPGNFISSSRGVMQGAPEKIGISSGSSSRRNIASATADARQSLAQKRAAHALKCVQVLKEMERSDGAQNLPYGNYVSYVKSLPAAILMNGLGQALAMEKANAGKDKGHDFLYRHMNAWLCNEAWEGVSSGWKNSPYANESDILEAIVSHDEAAYIRAQAEAMEYLEWLKKFAVALLKEKEGAD